MNNKLSAAFLAIFLIGILARAQNDNEGGVSCPAGRNAFTPTAGIVQLNPYTGNATRVVNDLCVSSVSEIGLNWTRCYNSRGTQHHTDDFGTNAWTHSYGWGFSIDSKTSNITITYPDGTVNVFYQNPGTLTWASTKTVPDIVLAANALPSNTFYLKTPDNHIITFTSIGGTPVNYLCTNIADSKNNNTILSYNQQKDGLYHLTQVLDASGHYLTVSYVDYPNNINSGTSSLISSITTSGTGGRRVDYDYESYQAPSSNATYFRLKHATYSDGYVATYTYTTPSPNDATYTDANDLTYSYLQSADDVRAVGVPYIQFRYFHIQLPPPGSEGPYPYMPPTDPKVEGFVCDVLTGDGTQNIVHAEWADITLYSPAKISRLVPDPGPNSYPLIAHGADSSAPFLTFPDGLSFRYKIITGGRVSSALAFFNGAQVAGSTFSYTQTSGVNGKWTNNIRDGLGRLSSTVQTNTGRLLSKTAGGSTKNWTYDTAGYCITTVDANNCTTAYTRDPNTELVAAILYPDNHSESFTYNNYGQIATHTRRNHGIQTSLYSSDGLLVSSTSAANLKITCTYDANYRVAAVTDGNNHTTSYLYNDRGQVTQETYHDNSFKSWGYDRVGNCTSETNELGKTWNYYYDDLNRMSAMTDPLARTTTYEYDPLTPQNRSPIYIHYPGGRVVHITYQPGFRYLPVQVTDGYGTEDAATTKYGYDKVGNKTSITDALGNITKFEYDALNRVTKIIDPKLIATSFKYDKAGNQLLKTTPSGTTTNKYDTMNRLISSEDPKKQLVSYIYNEEGLVHLFTDGNNKIYTYSYDLDGRITGLQYPDSTAENSFYDDAGYLWTFTNRSGNTKILANDCRNRVIGYRWDDGVTPAVSGSYDAAGRLSFLSNANSTISYNYDDANQLMGETNSITGIGDRPLGYTYNLDGTLQTLTYPDGTVLGYLYNHRKEMTDILLGGINGTSVAHYSYDSAGRRTRKGLANGVTSSIGYDKSNRLISLIDYLPSSGTLQRFDYGYDTSNRCHWVKRDNALGDVYGYDKCSQLTNIQYGVTNPDKSPTKPSRTVTYFFDAAGNRSSVLDSAVSAKQAVSYTPNSNNQYTNIGTNSLSYDTRGNLSAFAGSTFTYNANNQLVTAQVGDNTSTFNYDSLGRCVKRSENGVCTYNLFTGTEWELLCEYDASGAQKARYVRGVIKDELVSKTDSSSNVIYYHFDGLGSTSRLTSSTGALLEQYSYDVYGAPTIKGPNGNIRTTSACGNRFLFTGREFLASINLYDYRRRVYSPQIGRFLQPDPIGHKGDASNIYRFCGNNPVNIADPTGKFWQLLLVGGLEALAGEAAVADVLAIGAEEAAAGEIMVSEAFETEFLVEEQPQYLYRGDDRYYGDIFANGFNPRGTNMDLIAHITTNINSGYVSTSTSFDVAANNFATSENLEPGLVYALRPTNGIDVNEALGASSPMPWELEIAHPGGIAASDIAGVTPVNADGSYIGYSIINPNYSSINPVDATMDAIESIINSGVGIADPASF